MQSKPFLTQCPKSNTSPLHLSLSSYKVKNLVLYFTLLLTYSFQHLPGTLLCTLNNIGAQMDRAMAIMELQIYDHIMLRKGFSTY